MRKAFLAFLSFILASNLSAQITKTSGASTSGSNTFTGNNDFTGATSFYAGTSLLLKDPSATTKRMYFDISGITAGQTRILTLPDSDFTLVIPNCIDSGGNHLNYTAATHSWSCGTSGSTSLPVADTTSVVEGSADGTKEIRFEVDGLTTGTVRVITPPDANFTMAGTNITGQIFTTAQTFNSTTTFNARSTFVSAGGTRHETNVPANFGVSDDSQIRLNSVQTPDTLTVGVPATGNSVILAEVADLDFDFAHAQQTNPTFFFHSSAQSTTQWGSFAHNGSNVVASAGTGAWTFPGSGSNSNQIGVGAASTGTGANCVGTNCSVTATEATCFGHACSVAATEGSCFGSTCTVAAGHTDSMAFGRSSATTAANQLVFGANTAQITDIYFSEGVTNASPLEATINGTGGSGTNIAGGALTLAGGKGTGNATPGVVNLATSTAGASGTTLQTITNRVVVTSTEITNTTGHEVISGTAPAVTSCGTTPGTITGSDGAGRFTWGSGGVDATCTITFAVAYTNAPVCLCQDETDGTTCFASASASILTLNTVAATGASDIFSYICIAGN